MLADLRADLGVTEREHELLLRGIESRETMGRYALKEELARGATASVHLATDTETGREVVVKRYHSARDGARVIAEARALQAVRSPRIVRLLHVDRRDGEPFLVMERAAGGSARGPLPPERAVALVADLLEGLDALHAGGLVHGDVKCENLLVDADGRGLLADFGSARAIDPAATLTGGVVEGTLATLAPEVARGGRPSPASDVYGAAAVLYRLLTGEHPIDLAGLDALAARDRILREPPLLPHPRVPAPIEGPLRAALAKRPEDRPPGAAAFRARITAGAPGAIVPR
jgi:serine/threonine protein kinase